MKRIGIVMINRRDMNEQLNGEFQQKILLILAPSYPDKDHLFIGGSFVKNQVEELKNYFKKVIIIAPVFQTYGYLRKDKICKNYSYGNVEVYFPRSIYIPISWLRKPLIDNRLHIVEKTIKKHHLEFDLIHAHFTWPSGYIGIKLREKYGKPVVITIHEDRGWFDREIMMNHPFINTTLSEANALIRVNRIDVPVLQRYNKQVSTIPNGFSPAFHPIETSVARKELDISLDQKIIFSLGFLDKRKGFNDLIDAMEVICGQRSDVLCYIGGAGAELRRLQAQIDRLHLGEKVRLIGSVPGDNVPLWMNASDLYVLPSLNEGNPTVMFEALGCGIPFVGTSVGGVPEVITSDDYGFLVEPGNSGDLAEKILLALDREWDQEKILTYAEKYTWKNITKEIMNVYQQVSYR